MRISPLCMPSQRGGRWSTPSSPKCRRTPGSSFPGPPRCRSSRRSATARRDGNVIPGRCEASNYDVRLHIGESRDSGSGAYAPSRNDDVMPLPNRATPSGEIIAPPHRGMFTGNRGIIHDPATKTLLRRRWASRAWLTCVCEYKGRRRDVMATRSWTELFFLDEATAFGAGHRPCFFCRRDDASRFCAVGGQGNGVTHVRAPDIDAVL